MTSHTAQAERPAVAGRRVHSVSVTTITFLVLLLSSIASLIAVDVSYRDLHLATITDLLRSSEVVAAIRLSAVTSTITLVLVVLFGVPAGYALSRYRFPGHSLADTLVDLPIVLPPVVIGVSLLVLFATRAGRWIEDLGVNPHSAVGIVLCQFFVSVSYAVRAAKSAFDDVDRRLEHLAMTLGCTHGKAFWMVAFPMARNGVVAGAIMAWARALGVFGPLMVFVGCVRMKTEVMPTTIYLELTIGRIEVALAVTMIMLAIATVALVAIRRLTLRREW